MQGQFARRLYDLRYDLARRLDLTFYDIGKLIRSGDPSGSSRFQNLLEQTDLTARLVLALRDEDVQDAVPAIHRFTLSRIVVDWSVDNPPASGFAKPAKSCGMREFAEALASSSVTVCRTGRRPAQLRDAAGA